MDQGGEGLGHSCFGMVFLLLLLLLLSHFSHVCDPTDGSPPGSTIPGVFQARTLE